MRPYEGTFGERGQLELDSKRYRCTTDIYLKGVKDQRQRDRPRLEECHQGIQVTIADRTLLSVWAAALQWNSKKRGRPWPPRLKNCARLARPGIELGSRVVSRLI